jgi:hypothetical protein
MVCIELKLVFSSNQYGIDIVTSWNDGNAVRQCQLHERSHLRQKKGSSASNSSWPLLIHTPRWVPEAIGFGGYGLWLHLEENDNLAPKM